MRLRVFFGGAQHDGLLQSRISRQLMSRKLFADATELPRRTRQLLFTQAHPCQIVTRIGPQVVLFQIPNGLQRSTRARQVSGFIQQHSQLNIRLRHMTTAGMLRHEISVTTDGVVELFQSFTDQSAFHQCRVYIDGFRLTLGEQSIKLHRPSPILFLVMTFGD